MSSEEADRFQKMADRIRHNAQYTFGGAVVIVPPRDGGDPVEALILEEGQNAAQFWANIQTKAVIEIGKLEEKQRQLGAFGGRR